MSQGKARRGHARRGEARSGQVRSGQVLAAKTKTKSGLTRRTQQALALRDRMKKGGMFLATFMHPLFKNGYFALRPYVLLDHNANDFTPGR